MSSIVVREGLLVVGDGGTGTAICGRVAGKLQELGIVVENIRILALDLAGDAIAEEITNKRLTKSQTFQPAQTLLNTYKNEFCQIGLESGLFEESDPSLNELQERISGEGAKRDRRKALTYMRHPRIWDMFYQRLREEGRVFRDFFSRKFIDQAITPTVNIIFVASAGGGWGSGTVNEFARMSKKIFEEEMGLGIRQFLILIGAPIAGDMDEKELMHAQYNEYFALKDILWMQTNCGLPSEPDPNGRQLPYGPLYTAVYLHPLREMTVKEYQSVDEKVRDFILSKILIPTEVRKTTGERVLPLDNFDNAIRQAERRYCEGTRGSISSFEVVHLYVPSGTLEDWNLKKDRETELERLLQNPPEALNTACQRVDDLVKADYMRLENADVETWFSELQGVVGCRLNPIRDSLNEVMGILGRRLDALNAEVSNLNKDKGAYDKEVNTAREDLAKKSELNILGKRRLQRKIENIEQIRRGIQDDLMDKEGRKAKVQIIVNMLAQLREKVQKELDSCETELEQVRASLQNLEKNLETTQSVAGVSGFQLPFNKCDLEKFREHFWQRGVKTNTSLVSLQDMASKVYGQNRFSNIVRNVFEKTLSSPIHVDFTGGLDGHGPRKYPVQMTNLVTGKANDPEYIQSIFQTELGLSGDGEYGVGWFVGRYDQIGGSVYLAQDFAGIPPHSIRDFDKLEEVYLSLKDHMPSLHCYPKADGVSLSRLARGSTAEMEG